MSEPDAAAAVPPAPAPRVLEIRFTGSGSEYFRIWAVNLLLILLTCGLYLPFARMRRIRYVYANTLIDGEALAFHGDVWKMFRGFVLVAVLMLVYTFAGEFSPMAALMALVMAGAAWPALWRASMQFRLGNTSWRGLRMGFDGSLAGAYLALLPVYVPVAVFMWPGESPVPGVNNLTLGMVMMLAALLMTPWSTALLKRYQHRGYRISGERSAVMLSTHAVSWCGFKTLLLGVVLLMLAMIAATPLGELLALALTGKAGGKGSNLYQGLVFAGLIYLLGAGGLPPYYASRVQNLVWSNTRSASLQFHSELRGLTRLTLKNWLLIVATLGLYRPFAVMATMRLRLQAVRIDSRTDPATWRAARAGLPADASGDVAGDFFGVDVGL